MGPRAGAREKEAERVRTTTTAETVLFGSGERWSAPVWLDPGVEMWVAVEWERAERGRVLTVRFDPGLLLRELRTGPAYGELLSFLDERAHVDFDGTLPALWIGRGMWLRARVANGTNERRRLIGFASVAVDVPIGPATH